MLSHPGVGVELIDNIRRRKKCGLVGGSTLLGVGLEVPKAYARSNLYLSASESRYCSHLLLQYHLYHHVPTMSLL